MKKEMLIIFCLLFSISSNLIVVKADDENIEPVIEISFNLIDNNTGLSLDSAELFVIEGWTGVVFEQKVIQSGDSISIFPNHSFRFKIIHQDFDTWFSKSQVFPINTLITVNFTSDNEIYEKIIEDEINNTGGEVELEFIETMSSNTNLSMAWNSYYNFSMHLGVNLLPMNFLGLSGQIDYWFGNKDTILQINEQEQFLEWFSEQGWSDPFFGGCCRIDSNFIDIHNMVSPLDAWVDLELGIWGWNETSLFSVESGFTGSRLLEIPLQNDIRQLAKMIITTPIDWEFRYSPNFDWIEGSPTNIHVNRSLSGVSGYLPITFAKNTPPIASGEILGFSGSSLPLEMNITLDGSKSLDSSHNIGLGPNLECEWNITQNEIEISIDLTMIWVVNLSEYNFLPNSTITTKLRCEDPQGLNDTWEKNWYLDITPPNPIELFGDAECINRPNIMNLLDCEELLVESSKELIFNFSFSDDGPIDPNVYWTSNHIDGWYSEEREMNVIYWQGKNTNINFLNSEGHHEQRELAVWNLNVTLLDEVDNTFFKSWNVTVLDGSAPRINLKLMDYNEELEPLNDINFGDEIFIDINSSYDNIDSIEKVHFVIRLDDEILADSEEIGWDEINSIKVNNIKVGVHELIVNATDSMGNSIETKSQFVVFPAQNVNIISYEATTLGNKLVVGENNLEFRLVNSGGHSYDVIICIQDHCLDSNGYGATIGGYGYSNFTLTFNLNESDNLEISYKIIHGSEIIEFNQNYQFDFEDSNENPVILIIAFILVCFCVILFFKITISENREKSQRV
ncbi:MAG: hypothetical protein CMB64_07135 [Euryarchaeota archaeon]|nr:hypothetical protein [Euryarchaeota archaeon]|tara:strand:+ start:1288 stop:3666 length:2379 start_codon:yes stop_codon:yes gene_type:complete